MPPPASTTRGAPGLSHGKRSADRPGAIAPKPTMAACIAPLRNTPGGQHGHQQRHGCKKHRYGCRWERAAAPKAAATSGNAIMVTERRSTKPRARPRGSLSRFHRMTGMQNSAASRKRAAAPRKGGTYSARVSAATHVVPQTTPSAARLTSAYGLTIPVPKS